VFASSASERLSICFCLLLVCICVCIFCIREFDYVSCLFFCQY
jgi:hypothetical protein